MGIIRGACDEAGTFLSPWPVRSCEVSFSAESSPVTLHLAVGRDQPLREQEERWLRLAVAKKLQEEVVVKLSTVPLLPALTLADDGVPDASGVKALGILKELTQKKIPLRLTLHYPTGGRNNLKKARLLQGYLEKELGIAGERITLKSSGSSYLVTVQEEGG
jgi:hypothetical protein